MGQALEVWFVNVGHGDSTIVKFPSGRLMMVDINNSKTLDDKTISEVYESMGIADTQRRAYQLGLNAMPAEMRGYEDRLEDPIAVLKREYPNQEVFRFIVTHPDMDHIRGLYRLVFEEHGMAVLNFWDTQNTKVMTTEDFKSDDDGKNWATYQFLRQSKGTPTVLFLNRGDKGNYWTDDGMHILSPTREIVQEANGSEDWNHASYVFLLQYGKSRVLLTGDTSAEAQEEMAKLYGENLASTILKAPHHGRQSGYCGDFAKYVQPAYTIVSVGPKPQTDATDDYRYYTAKRVLTTRKQGTIRARLYYDGSVELFNDKGERLDLNEDQRSASHSNPFSRVQQ
jgi:beta-lactamase superfamily II metal-dependent hydrolase